MGGRSLLLVDQFGTVGGGQRILLGLVARAVEKGWSVCVAVPPGPLAQQLTAQGASVTQLDVPRMSDGRKSMLDLMRASLGIAGLTRQLNAAVASCRADVVHVNGGRVLLPTSLTASDVRFVFHAHTLLHGVGAFVARRVVHGSRSAGVIAPSAFMRDHVCRQLALSGDSVTVVENWVAPEFFSAAGDCCGGNAGNGVGVVCVGRVVPTKGQLDAVVAVLRLRRMGIPVVLTLVGDAQDAYLADLRVAARDDPGALRVVSRVDDVPAALAVADVAVVPSLWEEPFGLAAAEAMAMGVPVVAYGSGALPDVIGDAGVLVHAGDVEALAQALAKLAADPPLRCGLAEKGRTRALQRFAYPRQADKIIEVYERVVEERR